MVPKSGCDFETSQRVTTNFLKKNKKSFSGMKKTAKKISVVESKEKKEINPLKQEKVRKKVCIFQIFGVKNILFYIKRG